VLHDHEQFFLRLDNLVQLDNVGVANLLQNLDLASDTLDIFLVIDFLLLKNFYCHFFAGQNVRTLFDLAEGAFAQGFA